MKKIGVLTSGGDAPGMNAAVRAVVRTGIFHEMEVYGIQSGYEGLINGEINQMNVSSVSDIMHRGGTILRTARSERFMTPEGLKRAYDMMRTFALEAIVVIGGDGSLTGGLNLSNCGVTVMGVPASIDNDLGYTDFTIGFDTAVNTVLTAIGNIRDTSSSHERTTIIEVMGRHCGDIALFAGLTGGAEHILMPEEAYDINQLCRTLIQGRRRGRLHSIVIKAEGSEMGTHELADIIGERTGLETKIVVLGYVQRGGSPTVGDRMLASRLGHKAVELIKEGCESSAVGVKGNEIIHLGIAEALKEKQVLNMDIARLAEILSI